MEHRLYVVQRGKRSGPPLHSPEVRVPGPVHRDAMERSTSPRRTKANDSSVIASRADRFASRRRFF